MNVVVDVNLKLVDGDLVTLLNAINNNVLHLIAQGGKMAGELDQLVQDVKDERTAVNSTVVLLQGLQAKLDAAIAAGNPQALIDLSTEVKAQTAALVAAVVSPPIIGTPPGP